MVYRSLTQAFLFVSQICAFSCLQEQLSQKQTAGKGKQQQEQAAAAQDDMMAE